MTLTIFCLINMTKHKQATYTDGYKYVKTYNFSL